MEDVSEQAKAIFDTIVACGYEETMTEILLLSVEHKMPVVRCLQKLSSTLLGMEFSVVVPTREQMDALLHEGGKHALEIELKAPSEEPGDNTMNPEKN